MNVKRKAVVGSVWLTLLASASHASELPPTQQGFFAALTALCGSRFEGASTFPDDPAHDFAGKKLVLVVASCSADEIRMPFAVGADVSRTWLLRRDNGKLSLKHDHRHADGTPDAITDYGGLAHDAGSALAQSFHADAHTAQLIPAAATNVWTLSLNASGDSLTYSLERDGKPRYQAVLRKLVSP